MSMIKFPLVVISPPTESELADNEPLKLPVVPLNEVLPEIVPLVKVES